MRLSIWKRLFLTAQNQYFLLRVTASHLQHLTNPRLRLNNSNLIIKRISKWNSSRHTTISIVDVSSNRLSIKQAAMLNNNNKWFAREVGQRSRKCWNRWRASDDYAKIVYSKQWSTRLRATFTTAFRTQTLSSTSSSPNNPKSRVRCFSSTDWCTRIMKALVWISSITMWIRPIAISLTLKAKSWLKYCHFSWTMALKLKSLLTPLGLIRKSSTYLSKYQWATAITMRPA